MKKILLLAILALVGCTASGADMENDKQAVCEGIEQQCPDEADRFSEIRRASGFPNTRRVTRSRGARR